jgi:nicotinamidase-related amidase
LTTLPDRPNTAVVVIDLQNGVVAGAHGRDDVVGTIGGLVTRARVADTPVVWVQHSSDELPRDSDQWQLVPEVEPRAGEPVVHKRHGDSFEDTDLEDRLAGLGVGKLLITGAQTDACVRATMHGAFVRGYDVTLVSDAHTTEDLTQWGAPPPDQVISHTNLYWQFQSGPGREAEVRAASDVLFDA